MGIYIVRIVVRPLDRTWRIWEEGIMYATELTAKSRRIKGRRRMDEHREIDHGNLG